MGEERGGGAGEVMQAERARLWRTKEGECLLGRRSTGAEAILMLSRGDGARSRSNHSSVEAAEAAE